MYVNALVQIAIRISNNLNYHIKASIFIETETLVLARMHGNGEGRIIS